MRHYMLVGFFFFILLVLFIPLDKLNFIQMFFFFIGESVGRFIVTTTTAATTIATPARMNEVKIGDEIQAI